MASNWHHDHARRAPPGDHFLRPAEIETAFAEVGMSARTFRFGGGLEAVVVATRPG
jgi:hypothetical protein